MEERGRLVARGRARVMSSVMRENAGYLIVITVVILVALCVVIGHAILTRRSWRRSAEVRAANIDKVLGSVRTYNAVWGLDTRREVKRISRLRREDTAPKVSPHFVVGVSERGLAMLYGARGDQGLTIVYPGEFRSIKTATSGIGVYTTWYCTCVIQGKKVVLSIRVSDPSSDFLTAGYKWADAAAAAISALLKGEEHPPWP